MALALRLRERAGGGPAARAGREVGREAGAHADADELARFLEDCDGEAPGVPDGDAERAEKGPALSPGRLGFR